MTDLISFALSSMLTYALCALPVLVIVRVVVARIRRRVNWWHEAGLVLFLLCIAAIIPIAIIISQDTFQTAALDWDDYNLIPGRVFLDTWTDLAAGKTYSLLVNFFGNIVGFMPFGFFSCLLFKGGSARKAVLIGLSVSIFIEAWQLFIPRCTDIDDLWLNTLGAFLGYLLWRVLPTRFTERFLLK